MLVVLSDVKSLTSVLEAKICVLHLVLAFTVESLGLSLAVCPCISNHHTHFVCLYIITDIQTTSLLLQLFYQCFYYYHYHHRYHYPYHHFIINILCYAPSIFTCTKSYF